MKLRRRKHRTQGESSEGYGEEARAHRTREGRQFNRDLGQRIAARRKLLGLSQAQLARTLGVSQQTVFAYELGDRRVAASRLGMVARALRTTTSYVLGEEAAQPMPKYGKLSAVSVRFGERFERLPLKHQRVLTSLADFLESQT